MMPKVTKQVPLIDAQTYPICSRAVKRAFYRAYMKKTGAPNPTLFNKVSEKGDWKRMNMMMLLSDLLKGNTATLPRMDMLGRKS